MEKESSRERREKTKFTQKIVLSDEAAERERES